MLGKHKLVYIINQIKCTKNLYFIVFEMFMGLGISEKN